MRILITDDGNCIDGRTGTGTLDSERVPAFRVDPGGRLTLVKAR